ncbi:carbohydrate-binding domain-containing protein [Azospirillum sp. SYSU D00513]|uniref:carbohydrate-binding domain-containing protein n=1 Tax=Azospirillum sp. SYSU D00513 TaxID=2812561 RepID=UPI001A96D16F|nr:carbohydrate-binding domain-containing protein [Azospirillum sp. SYSU D00513]
MATTTGTTDLNVVVNAYGQSAGGVWPHFRLLIDGKDAGQATVSATNPSAYSFTTQVAAGQPHRVQVHYDNDASVNGQDRNLYVKSVNVNGHSLLPTQASYDRNALDGQDVVAGQEGMWWGGALTFDTPASYYAAATPVATTPAPTTGIDTITVNAKGIAGAHFNLLVDGKKVGEGTTGTTAKDFTFKTDLAAGTAHKVQVQYDNDGYYNGQDRSLSVNKITINGNAVLPTDGIVTYDKGALDGRDVVKGQSNLWWNGTLVVDAPKSYFPAGTTTVPPADTSAPVQGTGSDTITVSAKGAGSAHFSLLVDGKKVGEGTTTSTTKDFTFKTNITDLQAHKVQVQFDNDGVVNGVDRNLNVSKIAINGKSVLPTDGIVTYDKGALDGRDVVKGQAEMWWNGTLVVNADKSFFPANGTSTPTPTNPTPTNPTPADPGPSTPAPTGPAFYVAENGRDTWSGKLAAPNAAGTDGPFASLEKAQAAMRSSDISTTYVREGDYNLKSLLWLDGQDSGVRFAAYGSETPVIHGNAQQSVTIGLGGAKNVTLEGLTLTGGRADGHAVYANNASGLTFKNNTVEGGGYGITVENSANSKVTGNHFKSTGAESVYVKAGSNFTEVSDNLVQRPNAADRGDAGIWVNGSNDVKVTHNQIENSPAKAIAVGSVETTGSDATYRATIAFNKVINANLETTDGGGIYLINRQQDLTGHKVVNNEVTGTSVAAADPSQQVSWGIYLDDWTSGATVKGNLVHDNIGGVFLHGGWNNTVTDNLLASNSGAQIGLQQDVAWGGWKGKVMSNNIITQNIVDVTEGKAVHIYGPGTVGTFSENFYGHLEATERAFDVWPQVLRSGSTGTLADWQAAGYDRNSLTLDPQFTNPSQDNYGLPSNSVVFAHGFEAIPYGDIGLI